MPTLARNLTGLSWLAAGLALFVSAGAGCGRASSLPAAAPNGPFPVGNTSLILEDFDRPMGCGQGHRRLVTEVWYPAAAEAQAGPENCLSDFLLNQLEAARERFGEDALLDLPTGSFRDAPVNPEATSMPVLIFSHGFSSNRFQNYTMANYLAGGGFLVVAPDHTCNAMIAPLPDGAVFFSPADVPASLGERVEDLRFLIEVFTTSPPERFAGRLAPGSIGLWGHSFGGLTVTEAVKTEPRVSAMLQMAAFGLPGVPAGVELPSMFTWGEQDKLMQPFAWLHDGIIEAMPEPKYVLDFPDTGHFAFSDLCRFATPIIELQEGCGSGTRIGSGEPFENPAPEAMHEILNPYATAFFRAAFSQDPAAVAYLGENHFPGRIDYQALTE